MGYAADVNAPKIQRLRIENFRRIKAALELNLVAPKGQPCKTVVLAGPNGCGKTTVLEAVLLGLGLESLIVRDLEKSQREQHWRVSLEPGARIELDVALDGSPPVTWVRTSDKHYQRSPEGVEKDLPKQSAKTLAVEWFSSWRAPELVGSIQPLGAGKRPTNTENNRLWRVKQKLIDEVLRKNLPGASPGTNKAAPWLARINEAWNRFHGSDGTHIEVRQDERTTEEEGYRADLFVMRGATPLCSIDQISAGEIELLSFAGWIIIDDFKGGLLLIDEPELHLHPQWQATLLPALRMLCPEIQLVVASHADAVWDQAYSFERFLLVDNSDPRSQSWRSTHPSSAKESTP